MIIPKWLKSLLQILWNAYTSCQTIELMSKIARIGFLYFFIVWSDYEELK